VNGGGLVRKSILLIDDDLFVSEMTRQVLENLGYDAMTVTSAEAALIVFSDNPLRFDLILVGHVESDAHGVDFAEDLLCICSDVPIILYTNGPVTIDDVRTYGIRAVIPKGLSRQELGEALGFIFDTARRTDMSRRRQNP
jgi:DNA-binding response OmpR family regulator